MKNDIKEMRGALTPEEVLPNMLVVDVDSPEQYVEEKGLDTAAQINHLIKEETESIEDYNESRSSRRLSLTRKRTSLSCKI